MLRPENCAGMNLVSDDFLKLPASPSLTPDLHLCEKGAFTFLAILISVVLCFHIMRKSLVSCNFIRKYYEKTESEFLGAGPGSVHVMGSPGD